MNITFPLQNTACRAVVRPGILVALIMACIGFRAGAYEIIPDPPEHHFNDYVHVVSPLLAAHIEAQLTQFEKNTGGQIVIAIYSNMMSDASVEDFGKRVADAWRAGQKGKNNGLVLLIFLRDHVATLQMGPDNAKNVTDAICKDILDNEMSPHFNKGDFGGGLIAAVNAMMAATLGEYKRGKGASTSSPASISGVAATTATPVPPGKYKTENDGFTLSPAATATPTPTPLQSGT